MHPAASVIAFTTLSGLGYGLAFVLALGHGNPAAMSTKIAWFLALALISVGLLSSTLHLGNPQRAWRAFSQWRSSWLSREGVMAIVTFIPLTLLAAMSIFGDTFNLALGYVGAICCGLTVFCTAKIYNSLRTIPQWHSNWTIATYLGFALSSGTLAYVGLFRKPLEDGRSDVWTIVALAIVVFAWLLKFLWARNTAKLGYGKSTMESATGLGHIGKVRLLERPHAMGNYLTNEMAFRVARKHSQLLWKICVLLGLIIPVVCLVLALAAPTTLAFFSFVALITHMLGLFVERWLFFATARHAVGLYYGGDEALVPAE